MGTYTKAITAFLTSSAGMLAMLGIDPDWFTPEMIAALGVLINTGMVAWLPNKPKPA